MISSYGDMIQFISYGDMIQFLGVFLLVETISNWREKHGGIQNVIVGVDGLKTYFVFIFIPYRWVNNIFFLELQGYRWRKTMLSMWNVREL